MMPCNYEILITIVIIILITFLYFKSSELQRQNELISLNYTECKILVAYCPTKNKHTAYGHYGHA